MNELIRYLSLVDEKLGRSPVLISVRRGLTYMIPLLLFGSFALIIVSLPVPGYQQMMTELFGPQWQNIFLFIRDGTFNIMSLIMVLCISYSYSVEYCERHRQNISPIIAASVSLSAFIAVLGISRESFSITNFGTVGIFGAIVVAVSASAMFTRLSSLDFLRIKTFTGGANAAFQYATASLFPAAITIMFFAALNQMLSAFWGIHDIQRFVSEFLSGVFSGIDNPFWGAVLFIFLIHLFWFFGMHGSNVLEPVAQTIYVPALAANQASLAAGQIPTEIATKTFFDTFVLMGGCGTTLCLILAILLSGKFKNQRRLAKMSLVPVLFNINELIVFGIPIVLNPVFLIPFIIIPMILTVTAYGAMYYGLVPLTRNAVEWTTPIFLSGYFSTHAISGGILQAFNLVVGTLCYIPFVRLMERVADVQIQNNLEKVYSHFRQTEDRGMMSALLVRHDDIGTIARFLAADLEHDILHNRLTLFYQPQMDYSHTVFGIEALLRWKHDTYGYIYPPLIIALAEEARLIDRLGNWIIDTACRDLARLHAEGFSQVEVSVNISAVQLEDERFIQTLAGALDRHSLQPQALMIEITERLALSTSQKLINRILAIKTMGIKLAMDDFGMGHSSLLYLKEYEFDTIKLDGSLVREILTNTSCSNIISSIVQLGESLGYTVIAEYVEEELQRLKLHELGCERYQGYLYSPAVPYDELLSYLSEPSEDAELEIS